MLIDDKNRLRGMIETIIKPNTDTSNMNNIEEMIYNNISYINPYEIELFKSNIELGKTEGPNDKLKNIESLGEIKKFDKTKINKNETYEEKVKRRRYEKSDNPKKNVN